MRDKLLKQENRPSGLFLFYGDDFLIKQRLSSLTSSLLDQNNETTNLKIYDGADLSIGDLISFLMNRPLFGGARIGLVEQTTLFLNQANIARLVEQTLVALKAGNSKSGLRYLKQLAGSLDFCPQTAAFSLDWLKQIDEVSRLSPSDQELLFQAALSIGNDFSGAMISGDENVLFDFLQNSLPEDCYLIFTATSVDKRNRLLKLVQEKGQVEDLRPKFDRSFVKLDKIYFQNSVKELLRLHGKTIAPEALALAFSRSGKDLRRIRNEFQKLISYIGKRSEITFDDIQNLFLDFHEAAFFDLSKAIREANAQNLLLALNENLKIVDHPLQTLAAIASEFRKLIAARELLFTVLKSVWKPNMTFDTFASAMANIRSRNSSDKSNKGKFNLLAQKDFPLFQLLKTAQAFPLETLVKIMEMILEADIQIKSSKLGSSAPRIILENLVIAICDLRVV